MIWVCLFLYIAGILPFTVYLDKATELKKVDVSIRALFIASVFWPLLSMHITVGFVKDLLFQKP